jgi:hypothetical protein
MPQPREKESPGGGFARLIASVAQTALIDLSVQPYRAIAFPARAADC